MPLLQVRKLYRGDILFSQGDIAEEVFFVLDGGFTLYVDVSDQLTLESGTIDPVKDAFNVPYSLYVQGSYFGDSDCLTHM